MGGYVIFNHVRLNALKGRTHRIDFTHLFLATGRQPGANPHLATGHAGRGGQPGANRALDNRALDNRVPCVSIRGEGQPGGRNGFRQPGA